MNPKAALHGVFDWMNPDSKDSAYSEPKRDREFHTLVAIDMGAESCRVSLLRWTNGRPTIQLVHRFPNNPLEESVGLVWDIDAIISQIETGLRMCAELAPEGIAAIGVDCWAVDYVRLDSHGNLLVKPFCYRDERNVEAEKRVYNQISADRLYALTGIQLLRFNTLFQLYADGLSGMPASARWVNLPEYVLYRLGGKMVAEYTNATHTQLISLGRKVWNDEIFRTVGLDIAAAPPIVPPGTDVGELSGPLAALHAFRNTRLIAPACHDTASAIAGIPATGDDWAFLSSGTWSLIGALLEKPCVSPEAREKNYTNLGGAGNKICFLKNVNGMWLLTQCMEEWARAGKNWEIEDLVLDAESVSAPTELLDLDDPEFLQPGSMPARINAQRARMGLKPLSEAPGDAPVIARLVFDSLAARYAAVLRDLQTITGKKLKRLFVVGGGSRNELLNRLTARTTGLDVIRGPVESSTIGNFAIQMAALENSYDRQNGVTCEAVAEWAEVLGTAEFVSMSVTAVA